MIARYYDSNRGQFISQDPVHLEIGNPAKIREYTKLDQADYLRDPQLLNSYSYAVNNPIVKKDPEGRFAIAIPLYYGAATALNLAPTVIAGVGVVTAGTYAIYEGAKLTVDMIKNSWGIRYSGQVQLVDFNRFGLNQSPTGPEDWEPKNWDKASKLAKIGMITGIVATGVAHVYEATMDFIKDISKNFISEEDEVTSNQKALNQPILKE